MKPPRRVLPVLCTSVLLGVFSPAAWAQVTPPATPAIAAEEAVQLSVFEVTTSRDIGYKSTNAAEATRMNTPIEDVPMNVTIYNQRFIEDLLATDTSELMAYEPSLVKTSNNDGFMARGSASVGSNFLNGFAQTGGSGSQPLANVERVEVLRGPAAVLYGSGGYGGTINRITKQPGPRRFFNLRTIWSDYRSSRNELDFNSPLGAFGPLKFYGRLNGTYQRKTAWFGQRQDEDAIAPSLRLDLLKNTQVTLEYFYQRFDKEATWETPVHAGDPNGLVTGDGVYRVVPRKVKWTIGSDYRDNRRHVAATDVRHAFSDALQFRSQFQYEKKIQAMRETSANNGSLTILRDTALVPRSMRDLPNETYNYRLRNELIAKIATGPLLHRLLVGHGWQQQYSWGATYRGSQNNGGITGAFLTGDGKLTDAQAGPALSSYPNLTYAQFLANPRLAGYNTSLFMPMNLFDRGQETLLFGAAQPPPLYYNAETDTYLANTDIYANDAISMFSERVFLVGGVRRSQVVRKTINWVTGTFPNQTRRASAPTTYRDPSATRSSFGAVWHLTADKSYSLYANLNSSFNPQFNFQPDGSELEPETGNQKEAGFRFSLLRGRISGLVSWFDLQQDNVTQADPAPGRTGYFIQVNGQRSTGLELNLNGRLTDQWLVMGGFSDTDARNQRTGVAKDLSPRFRFTMFNRYNFKQGVLKNLNLSLGTIYTGSRDLTAAASARNEPNWGPLPAWWRVDAIAGYRFKVHRVDCDVSLKVNNVFDNRDIYFVASWFRYTIDPGRDWQAVARMSF